MLFAADDPSSSLSLQKLLCFAGRIYLSLENFAHYGNVPNSGVEAAYRAELDKSIASNNLSL
ncbi:MAG: hypothetical protein WBE72_07355 [Terracidiphilus sp.]